MSVLGASKARLMLLVLASVLLVLSLSACVDEDILGVFVTMKAPGVTEDGVEYGTDDILMALVDEGEWFKIFEGSEFGLTPKHNIAAFSFNEVLWYNLMSGPSIDPDDLEIIPELYLTFTQNRIAVPGIPGMVYGQDIVKFSEEEPAGPDPVWSFELFFDGSDVGLTTAQEKIDGLGVWSPEYFDYFAEAGTDLPFDCAGGVIFVTTQGKYRVPSATPGQDIVGNGSDVLLFCAFNTGPDTAGLWYRVYNGTEEGISPPRAGFSLDVLGFQMFSTTSPAEDLDAGVFFMFTPRTRFTAPGLSEPGLPSQLFAAATGSGVDGPFLDFDDEYPAVNGVVDGISLFDMPFYVSP